MNTNKLLALLLLATMPLLAFKSLDSGKYFTKDGYISFFSKTNAENIEAHNRKVTSVVDAATGQIQFAVLMKAFEFEKALMQEHFNENYVESDKFPKAEFKGKIVNVSDINFAKDGSYPANVVGDLTLHGITKPATAKGTFAIKGTGVEAKAVFKIVLADYKIAIPSVVKDQIAKEIEIRVNINYKPLAK